MQIPKFKGTFKSSGHNCDCPISCTSRTYIPSLSYAALSQFNAKEILAQEPAKIARLRRHFHQVLEVSAWTLA